MRSLNKQIETATASLIKHADTVQSMKERYVELTSEVLVHFINCSPCFEMLLKENCHDLST